MDKYPLLKEQGISKQCIRYLFKPVKKGTHAASRYKRVIDAEVPKKDNSLHNFHENGHVLHSRIKLRREMATHFSEECVVLSVDSMNKLRYGTLCVSRYHQIRKIYMTDDAPRYKDHDFPSKYKKIPDGIMILGDALNIFPTSTAKSTMSDPEKISTTQISNILKNLKDTNLRKGYEELGHHLFRGRLMIVSTIQVDPPNLSVLETQLSFEVIFNKRYQEFDCTKRSQNIFIFRCFLPIRFKAFILEWTYGFVLLSVSMLYSITFSIITNTDILPVIIVHHSSKTISSKCIFLGLQIDGPDKMSFFPTIEISDKSSFVSMGEFEGAQNDETDDTHDINHDNGNVIDVLGRSHLEYPHTGPSVVYLRNNFLHSSTCIEHINDLFPICTEATRNGVSSILVISDNGPDYNPTSVKNDLLYYELWKKSGLDCLTITSNAAGLSAFNPICGHH